MVDDIFHECLADANDRVGDKGYPDPEVPCVRIRIRILSQNS